MALQGCLKIGGRTYGVVSCDYSFSQLVDAFGKPNARPAGGKITFTIPSTTDEDMFFYNWMFHKTEAKSGILQFCLYSHENKRVYKTVSFVNAFCIGLHDVFNNNNQMLMLTTITISAQLIRVGMLNASTFVNPWTTAPVATLVANVGEHIRDSIAEKINPF